MYTVYILYSVSSGKTYTGYTNDLQRRLREHNETETKGYTLRYRPWIVVHTEEYSDGKGARSREKYLKTGKGREEIKQIITLYLQGGGAVSAVAEKD
jgi:putative endonuclease